jgi:hypothetical protein
MYKRLGATRGALLDQRLILVFVSMAKETKTTKWKQVFFIRHRIISTVDFISERMSYKVLRGCWCNSIVFNVHAPVEENSEDSKGSVYEKLKQVFNYFSKYHIKILVRDFNVKWGEGILLNRQLK